VLHLIASWDSQRENHFLIGEGAVRTLSLSTRWFPNAIAEVHQHRSEPTKEGQKHGNEGWDWSVVHTTIKRHYNRHRAVKNSYLAGCDTMASWRCKSWTVLYRGTIISNRCVRECHGRGKDNRVILLASFPAKRGRKRVPTWSRSFFTSFALRHTWVAQSGPTLEPPNIPFHRCDPPNDRILDRPDNHAIESRLGEIGADIIPMSSDSYTHHAC